MQYADIDHMDERKIFTVDDVNFAGLNDYFVTLRDRGMRTIIILVGSWDSLFRVSWDSLFPIYLPSETNRQQEKEQEQEQQQQQQTF